MGVLTYGAETLRIEFDDQLLAHIQAIITAKLRRNESFTLSWQDPRAKGDGRTILWINQSIPLGFHFEESTRQPLDAKLLEDLSIAAASANGLDITPLVKKTKTGRLVRRSTM